MQALHLTNLSPEMVTELILFLIFAIAKKKLSRIEIMKFKLYLKIDRTFGDYLPFNYQYEQSAVIYNILSKADRNYSLWLHENGFSIDQKKRFKLFTYSPFYFQKYRTVPHAGCLNIIGDNATWYINFVPQKSTDTFIQGVFNKKRFVIGNKYYKVSFSIVGIELMPQVELTSDTIFQALSPICVKLHNDGEIKYLSPDNALFEKGLYMGLISRFSTSADDKSLFNEEDFSFVPIEESIRPKLITIKAYTPEETRVKGYLCSFRLKAPKKLIALAYEGGIGEQCSQGFGYITTKKIL